MLSLAGAPAAQEKSKWRRVYTFDDAVIHMEVIKLSFGNFGRVRFRTVFDKPKALRGSPGVTYKTQLQDMELMCSKRQYRVTETDFLDARGKVVWSYKVEGPEVWKDVRAGGKVRLEPPSDFDDAHTNCWAASGIFLVVDVGAEQMVVTALVALGADGELAELLTFDPAGRQAASRFVISRE